MVNAPVLHVGLRSPAECAYDLAQEDRLHRWEDWRHDAAVQVRPEAAAAEKRVASSAEAAVLDLVRTGDWYESDATVVLDGLRPDATTAAVALALGVAARCRRDIGNEPLPAAEVAHVIAAGLLRCWDDLVARWWAVCETCDEQYELRTDDDGSAVDKWAPAGADRVGWRQERLGQLDDAIEGYARKAVG